jgi:O-antigen/teichoic acid export membrane protein
VSDPTTSPSRFARIRSVVAGRSTADVGWVLSSNLIGLVGNALSVVLVASRIGASSFGEYAVAYATAGLLAGFIIHSQLLAYLDYAVRVGEPPERVAGSTIGSILMFGGACVLVACGVVTGLLDAAAFYVVLPIALSELVFNPISMLCANVLQSERGFLSATKLRWFHQVFRVMATVVFWVVGATTLGPLTALILLFSVVSTIVSLVVLARVGYMLSPRPPKARYLRTSAALASAIVTTAVHDDGDKLVLARSAPSEELGQYAFAYRLLGVALVPLGAMLSVAYNRILSLAGKTDDLRRVTVKFLIASSGYGLLVGIGAFAVQPVLTAILPDDFDPSAGMFAVLAWVVLARGFSGYMATFVIASGRQATQAVINLVVSVIGVVMYVTLIPTYGWAGAAAGTLVGEILGAAITSVVAMRIMSGEDEAPPVPVEVGQRA